MSIPQNRSIHQSTHQAPEAFRETVRRITEEIQNNHRPGYGVQIPQSLLETDLPSMAIAIRNVGRFAVVLDPATAASGDGPSHQSPETTSQSASASPLAAIGAAIIYQSVLHHRTRCYAEVMPVLALEGRIPDDSLLRAADRLDVQVVMYHQSVISELERLSRLGPRLHEACVRSHRYRKRRPAERMAAPVARLPPDLVLVGRTTPRPRRTHMK